MGKDPDPEQKGTHCRRSCSSGMAVGVSRCDKQGFGSVGSEQAFMQDKCSLSHMHSADTSPSNFQPTPPHDL